MLAEQYIAKDGSNSCIAWVANHSRHSEIALLADVVQVALLYEPENEDLAIEEAWAQRSCKVFNDHFILVGPPADLRAGNVEGALRTIAQLQGSRTTSHGRFPFITRGDGSATFAKEKYLFEQAGVNATGESWFITHPVAPYDALLLAEESSAFLLTDRATFLTAKNDGKIPSLQVHIQGGHDLLNPCSALVKSDGFFGSDQEMPAADIAARRFACWLGSEDAQQIIEGYGRDWPTRKPLFTRACKEEFLPADLL